MESEMEEKEITHIGDRIKEIRRELRISQKDFAEKIAISGSFLSEVESGKCKPGYEFLKNVTHKFSVNPLFLLTGSSEMFLGHGPRDLVIPDDDYGEYSEMVREMLDTFRQSPVVKMAVLEFYRRYVYQHKGMIEEDTVKHAPPTQHPHH